MSETVSSDYHQTKAGADTTPEESSVVERKNGDSMSDYLVNWTQRWPMRQTKSADTRAVEAYLQQSQRRDRYIDAIKSLRNTLVELQEGQPVSDRMVELLDALLDMETEGETR